MQSIFVSIASYRDPELMHTVRSLVTNRTGNVALHIHILAQCRPGEEFNDFLVAATPNVTIEQVVIRPEESRGVCWARAEIQRRFAGEDFYLQIDSHMQMAPSWDEIVMADHHAAAGARPALLTAYLPNYQLIGTQRVVDHMDPVHFKVVQRGWLPTAKQMIGFPHTRPVRAPFFSGHFVFAPGRFIEDVPYDPELFFFGEEISMALRAYCSGYDLFTPSRFVGAHLYERLRSPGQARALYWDADDDGPRPISAAELDKASKIKVREICGGRWRGRYGIRNMARYKEFRAMLLMRFGVDLSKATHGS